METPMRSDPTPPSRPRSPRPGVALAALAAALLAPAASAQSGPPVAAGDSYVTMQPELGARELFVGAGDGLLANDSDPDGDALEAEIVDPPPVGSLVAWPDGGFSYLPPDGFRGEVELTYVATDGESESAPASARIVVGGARRLAGDGDRVVEGFDLDPLEDDGGEVETDGFVACADRRGGLAVAGDARVPGSPPAGGAWRAGVSRDFPPVAVAGDAYLAGATVGAVYDGALSIPGSEKGRCEALLLAVELGAGVDAIRLSGRIEAWWADAGAADAVAVGFEVSIRADAGNGPVPVLARAPFVDGPLTPPLGGGALDGNAGGFDFDTGVIGAPAGGWPAGTIFEVLFDAAAVGPNEGWVVGIDDVVFESAAGADLPPVAVDDVFEVGQGGAIVANVLTNDFDPEGDALGATLVSGPAHAASFALAANGSFYYEHDCSETAQDGFVYRAVAGGLESDDAFVTLDVVSIDDGLAALLDAVAGLDAPFFVRLVLAADVRTTRLLWSRGSPFAARAALLGLARFLRHVAILEAFGLLSPEDADRLRAAADRIGDGFVSCAPAPRFPGPRAFR
jgi:hypothetical protein